MAEDLAVGAVGGGGDAFLEEGPDEAGGGVSLRGAGWGMEGRRYKEA